MLEEVAKQLSASNQSGTIAMHELVSGRFIFVEYTHSAGCGPFVSRFFEFTEIGEALDLTTAIEVREEIQIHRTRRIRSQVVSTTLRRELAEVIETDGPDATP